MKTHWTSITLLLLLLIVSGCSNDSSKTEKNTKATSQSTQTFGEDSRLYDFAKKDSVVTFYVTINSNNATSFYEMDHWYSIHNSDSESPKLDILIQEGGEKGPEKGKFAADATDVNASIELRGKSTRIATQKSFKIKLNDSTGLWQGQKTLNLNKHPYDATRIRNKLSFDYFTEIPHLTSMRTQFVHLYIKDLTNPNANDKFVDFGLYTQIEQANERFLATHGLDSNGNLYKAVNFEFYRYSDEIKLESDPAFRKKTFEAHLEIKGSNDHRKLIAMLEDVNNYALNINDVVSKHFDRDNYLTWVAANILIGNRDVTTQNFYLYSPSNTEKWYFLPWDYDGAWTSSAAKENIVKTAEWEDGLSNYWGSVLHKRFFKDPRNVKDLSAKIEALAKIITPEKTKKLLDEYYPTVSQFIKRQPDTDHLGINVKDYKANYYSLTNESVINKKMYYRNLEKPMPFFLNDYENKKKQYVFEWEASYDIQGDDVTYTLQISKDPAFHSISQEIKTGDKTSFVLPSIASGTYYWRVIAKDAKGNTQMAFDEYEDVQETRYFGIKKFIAN
ncbi:CotH kinase family protein [Bacillus rubiinfantis]|uniref:CotH kinase family protein n=1 Tax=Bacillus rubiinfantis TaxID=1499680 RepID=UPI0005A75CE5|nr:CotH kinase family protein [Bacillus rubiinfantis]